MFPIHPGGGWANSGCVPAIWLSLGRGDTYNINIYVYYAFYIQPQNTGKSGVLGKNQFRSGYGSDLACSDPDPNGDIQKLSFLKKL